MFVNYFKYQNIHIYINLNRYSKQGQICVNMIVDVIRILYTEIKVLEAIHLPDYIEMIYEPLEDELSDCIYFQNSELLSAHQLKVKLFKKCLLKMH